MSAADRFIDGEDRLSALLKSLPAYAPSAALEASVREAARAAQQEADRVRAGAAPLPFPAPPTLAAAVLEEAARVQAAQAARRDALLGRVAAGGEAADVLGAPVSEATRDWLAAEARANVAAQKEAQSRTFRAVRARQWWRSLGLAASVAAVAGLTTSIVLRQIDDGALVPSTTREMSAPAQSPAADIAVAPAPEPAPEAATAAPSNPAPPAAKTAPPPRREEQRATANEDKRSRAPVERSAPREPATDSKPAAQAGESLSAQAPAIVAAPPAMPAPPMPAYSAMADAAPPAAAPAPPPPTAPAPQANVARKAAPLAAARAPVSTAASVAQAMTVSIQDDPAATAARLGTLTPLGLWAAEPDNTEIREWAERLWQSMPAGQRPPVPYAVQADRTLAPGQVRIDLQPHAPR
ncbi:hypothetical protein [Cupriavidus necator]|uniref:hypothetical protein n=1 Tax=Cupriavidus necator TaxID=106590 RepID=UPI00339D49D0